MVQSILGGYVAGAGDSGAIEEADLLQGVDVRTDALSAIRVAHMAGQAQPTSDRATVKIVVRDEAPAALCG